MSPQVPGTGSTAQQPTPTAQQAPSSTVQHKTKQHRKKNASNCADSAAAPKAASGPSNSANPAANKGANNGSGNAAAANNSAANNAATNNAGAPLNPCPPTKKVVRNGGSNEPAIQLIGGTPAERASEQRSTEELSNATQENLKKIGEQQSDPSRQQMVSQIKEFVEQSKAAVAAGDLERGHDLAQKAHLLSEELVKP